MNLVDLLIRSPGVTSIGVIVIISRPSHSPVNRLRSVISGCRVTRMERSASACHSCTFNPQYFVAALRLACSPFLLLNFIYAYSACVVTPSFWTPISLFSYRPIYIIVKLCIANLLPMQWSFCNWLLLMCYVCRGQTIKKLSLRRALQFCCLSVL